MVLYLWMILTKVSMSKISKFKIRQLNSNFLIIITFIISNKKFAYFCLTLKFEVRKTRISPKVKWKLNFFAWKRKFFSEFSESDMKVKFLYVKLEWKWKNYFTYFLSLMKDKRNEIFYHKMIANLLQHILIANDFWISDDLLYSTYNHYLHLILKFSILFL
jgi:hypothetical protein